MFVGTPGSGKTTLIEWLLEPLSSVVVLDSKQHPAEYAAWGPRHGYVVTSDPEQLSRHPKVVLQVDQIALDDRGGWHKPDRAGYRWTETLVRILDRGHTTVVFDEVLQTLPAGQAHPQARRLFTQGRAFGLSVWCGTQVANRADTLVFRLAEHCFAFWTGNELDLKLLKGARGVDPEALTELERYQFAYHQAGSRTWQVCDRLPLAA